MSFGFAPYRILLCQALLACSTLTTEAQSQPNYDPVGVQNDVPVETVLSGGWRVLYKGLYKDGMPSLPALFRGACGKIMLAGKRINAANFDVLAAIETDIYVPLITPRHETVFSNGAEWYKNDQSMGFAGKGDTINQTSADTSRLFERDRLSWHTIHIRGETDTRLNPGWRSGDNFKLEKSNQWERYLLTTIETNNTTSGNGGCVPIG